MLTRILTVIIIFANIIKIEPSADLIQKTREKIAQINISFLENNTPGKSVINELEKLLNELKNDRIFPNSIINDKKHKYKTGQLIKSFKTFEKFLQSNPEVDTLKKIFRIVNNEFNSLFGNYFLDELKGSSRRKIILFSTSVSRECTLEMCYLQECEIQKLQKENTGLFDYAVVDCFTNSDLQSKHEVGFFPTVIILDSKNKEMKRFVRREKFYEEIVNYMLNIN